jgi:exonuclease 3'-5' domain-containing protein 1
MSPPNTTSSVTDGAPPSLPNCEFISSAPAVSRLIDILVTQPTSPPSLYVDLEGVNLSRLGSISLFQIYVSPIQQTFILDIHILNHTAFTTPGIINDTATLKTILESPTIPIAFYDVRNDSDALYSHFSISLQCVHDIQLMENAARPAGQRRLLSGLNRCMELDAGLSFTERTGWKTVKENGVRLFVPEKGGSYEVFNRRPLSLELLKYCANDVVYLPTLRSKYWGRLSVIWREEVLEEGRKRVRESQETGYKPNGSHKALGPW